MHPTKISIPSENRVRIVTILNQALADLSDLHSQTKQAHWNVRGPLFHPLHKLFDDLAEVAEGPLDDIAERATALGGVARGTLRQAAAASRLPEFPSQQDGDLGFVVALRDRFAQVANDVRSAIDQTAQLGDADTADLFTGISRDLDKALWMLEAHNA